MTDITRLSAAAMVAGYAAGRFTPVDVAEAAMARITGPLKVLNAIASFCPGLTHSSAEASAERWKAGRPLGPLDGVPISFKDSFHMKGFPRWHGTACHSGTPSPGDALPVQRAYAAGMVPTAKTTMPDFAMVMSGLSSEHGIIRNAWDPATSPGGSSSGAGPSVVLGGATVALGTDMVGSVRLPAALSGLASIKPTQGRIAYDPPGSYRSAGPMARCVADVELTLAALGQFSDGDFFSAEGRFVPAGENLERLDGKRIGLWRQAGWGDTTDAPTLAAVATQAERLADLGAEIIEIADIAADPDDYMAIHWYMLSIGAPDYFSLTAAERGRIHPVIGAMYDGMLSQSAIFLAGVNRRIAVATTRIAKQLDGFDYILSPALPVRAFPAELSCPDPALGAMSHQAFACWFNQIGWPAATVAVHDMGDGGCPVSVQIAGKRFDDAGVLQVAKHLEVARGFDIRWPEAAG